MCAQRGASGGLGLQGLHRQYRLFAQMVKDTKRAQEPQTQGDQPALAQPDRRESLDSRQTPLRAKGTIYKHWQRPSTIQRQMFKSLVPTYSVRTVCIIKRKGPLSRRFSVTGATHISLLCISSMRSVKRTSLFLSQKPSAS